MRLSDWSSDVCSSDLLEARIVLHDPTDELAVRRNAFLHDHADRVLGIVHDEIWCRHLRMFSLTLSRPGPDARGRLLPPGEPRPRSLFTMMELYVMSYIRPRGFSRATSEMHARSRHHSTRDRKSVV